MGRGIVREGGASLLEALEDSCGSDSRDWERAGERKEEWETGRYTGRGAKTVRVRWVQPCVGAPGPAVPMDRPPAPLPWAHLPLA